MPTCSLLYDSCILQGEEGSDERLRSFYRQHIMLVQCLGLLKKKGMPMQQHVGQHLFIQLAATSAGVGIILTELELNLKPWVFLTAPNGNIMIKLMVGEVKATYTKGMLLMLQATHLTEAMSNCRLVVNPCSHSCLAKTACHGSGLAGSLIVLPWPDGLSHADYKLSKSSFMLSYLSSSYAIRPPACYWHVNGSSHTSGAHV